MARNLKQAQNPTKRFHVLTAALGAVLFCQVVATAADTEPRKQGAVTFNKDIAPIVFAECATCHRPGEVAPFPLLTYQDVKKRAEQIHDVTAKRYMPPWKSVPGHGEFRGERRLSDEELGLIDQWVRSGAPEGKASDLPPIPKFPEGWQLGKPDLIVTMPEAYEISAEGADIYRNFVLQIPELEGRNIKAVEFHPSNRRIVHHAVMTTDPTERSRKRDADDPGPGFTNFNIPGQLFPGGLAIWVPGLEPLPLPTGFSMPWPKGADLVLQLHLHPSGKVEKEQSTIGFYFTDEKPQKSMLDVVLIQKKIDMPPGEKAYRTRDELVLPADFSAVGVFPHMHLLGKEVKITATAPDGTVTPLIWINDWDFNWQGLYQYAAPITLKSGTRLVLECVHDNSADNPRNPSNPPKRVTWGEQTTDEMSVAILQLVPHKESDLAALASLRGRIVGAIVAGGDIGALFKSMAMSKPSDPSSLAAEMTKKALSQLDRDGDGKLSIDELVGFQGATREKIEQYVGRFDGDKDGKLDASELTAVVQSISQGAAREQTPKPSGDEGK
jgi:mono/diheme cytochrome c family protein